MSISLGRWVAKKLARRGAVFGVAGTGALAARSRFEKGPSVRALMYHRFGDAIRGSFCVDAQTLEKQVRWLAQEKLAVSRSTNWSLSWRDAARFQPAPC